MYAKIRFTFTAEGEYAEYWIQLPSEDGYRVRWSFASKHAESICQGYMIGTGFKASIMGIEYFKPNGFIELDIVQSKLAQYREYGARK